MFNTDDAEEIYDLGMTKTSSLQDMLKAFNAISSATVPFETATVF